MKTKKSTAKENILTREDVLNHDYDYWAKMEEWEEDEVAYLISGLQPPEKLLKDDFVFSYKFEEHLQRNPYDSDSDGYGFSPTPSQAYWRQRHLVSFYEELLSKVLPFHELKQFRENRELFGRSFKLFVKGDSPFFSSSIRPHDVVRWATNRHVPIPDELIEKVKIYHADKFSETIGHKDRRG